MVHHLRNFLQSNKQSKPILFAGVFGIIGVVFLLQSFAATAPNAKAIEAENFLQANSANVTAVSDTTASNSAFVLFNGAPTTPTPTPSPTPPVGSCPNAQHTPGGPDGMGGCWPYEGNTGVPAGTTLSNYTGNCIITAANTIIDSKTINCNLDIRAQNVSITKSQINGYVMVDDTRCDSASVTITDTTIHTNDINFRGLIYCSYTATRVNVSGGQSMAFCRKCTIQDSYLHSPLEDPAGAAANQAAHNSTVRMADNAIIKHNTLWCEVKEYPQPNGQDTSGCSANQTGYSHDGAPPFNSRVEANLYMPTSGGYCAYGGSTSGALSSVHDIVFKDNIFKKGTKAGQHGQPVCGYYGAVTSFDSSRPGNQWINNRWDDGTVLQPAL